MGTLNSWGSVQGGEGVPHPFSALSQLYPGHPPQVTSALYYFPAAYYISIYFLDNHSKTVQYPGQQTIIVPNNHDEGPIALQFHTKPSFKTLDWN